MAMQRQSNTRILVDGGDPDETLAIKNALGYVDGQTTNPSLIAKNPEIAELVRSGHKLTEQQEMAEYRKIEGNRGVLALRRVADGQAEFLLVSLWDSESAIQRFVGPDIDRAVFYPEDEQFLIDRDDHVTHYEVVFDSAPVAQG